MKTRRFTDIIAVHCSATKPSMDIGAAEIRRWHVDDNGWSDIGYHFIIRRNGTVEIGRDIYRQGAHEPSINERSVAVCLVGGLAEDGSHEAEYTDEQWLALETTIHMLLLIYPGSRVAGHNEFSNKSCPSFYVPEWWEGEA